MKDRYEIEDMVVQDESGVTFRARDRKADQAVSLRRFFPAESGGGFEGEEVEAFAGTVEALKQLRHPSLCGVLDGGVDEVDGIPYLVTEWAEGERLSEMLENGPLAPEQAVAVAGQALEVLEALRANFGDGAGWLEMEAVSVLVNAESGVCSFMICPLQVLGVAPREGGVKGLGYLLDAAMGWNGRVVPPAAAAGLGGWVRHAKDGSWSVQQAYNELVKIRSVWTGEEVPEEAAVPQMQVNRPVGAGAPGQVAGQVAGQVKAPSQALVAPTMVYSASGQSSGGKAAAMVFFGVLLLGGGVWLGMAKPWEEKVVQEGPKVVVLERGTGKRLETTVETPTEKPAEKPAEGAVAKVEPKGEPEPVANTPRPADGKKETPQERIDRIARETTEKMGIEEGEEPKPKKMPEVFGADDGGAIRQWMGAHVTLEAELFRIRDSRSGKTRYLEFSDDIGKDVVAVRCWPNEDFELGGLEALVGKKLRFKGKAEEERGTGRIVVHLEERGQIEEVD